jgi:protease I
MMDPEIFHDEINLFERNILFILPPGRFRDEEYSIPRSFFEKGGARVTVASSSVSTMTGMLGARVAPDVSVDAVDPLQFDAVLLVGGVGSSKFWHNHSVHRIVTSAHAAGAVVSAICLAPVTLANAGLLSGKRATAYPSAEGLLKWKGATFTGEPVETAGNIVTANGPEAANEFAQTVAGLITKIIPSPKHSMTKHTSSETNHEHTRTRPID